MESIPHISMDPRVHYTTQSRVWDSHILGPLTNRAISRYYFVKKPSPPKVKRVKAQKPLTILQRLLA